MERKEFIGILLSFMNDQGTYHNHKETIIWAAIASFTAIIVVYLTVLSSAKVAGINKIFFPVFTTISIPIVTTITLCFLEIQLDDKFIAAVRSRVLIRAVSDLATKPWPFPESELRIGSSNLYPKYIENDIEKQTEQSIREKKDGIQQKCWIKIYIVVVTFIPIIYSWGVYLLGCFANKVS